MLPSLVEPLNHNPLYKRLVVHQTSPTWRATIILTLVLGLISIVLSLLSSRLMFVPACLSQSHHAFRRSGFRRGTHRSRNR